MDASFLDELHDQASSRAKKTYSDAKLYSFDLYAEPPTFIGFSYDVNYNVSLELTFYSKLSEMFSVFKYSDSDFQLKHITPDKPATEPKTEVTFHYMGIGKIMWKREIMTSMPWNDSPFWKKALNLGYFQIRFPLSRKTKYPAYQVHADRRSKPDAQNQKFWRFVFFKKPSPFSRKFQSFTSMEVNSYCFEWDGKIPMGESNFREVISHSSGRVAEKNRLWQEKVRNGKIFDY